MKVAVEFGIHTPAFGEATVFIGVVVSMWRITFWFLRAYFSISIN